MHDGALKEYLTRMEQLTKRQLAREEVFRLLFEYSFRKDVSPEEIYEEAKADRGFSDDAYIKNTFFGTVMHLDDIFSDIDKHAVGWKRNRISAVSLAVMELCIYEMRFSTDVPPRVALNEALLLCRRYDEEKARPFLNGVLNAVLQEVIPLRGDDAQ